MANIIDIHQDPIFPTTWDELVNGLEDRGVTGITPNTQPTIKDVGGGMSLMTNNLQSPNYKAGTNGWRLFSNGDVEFESGKFRGELVAATGTIGGWTIGATTLSSTNLTIDSANEKIESANYSAGVSGFTIGADLIEAQNLISRGTIRGSTFTYDMISAVGGQLMISDADALASDMTALDASTLTIKGDTTFAVDDFLVMRGEAGSGIEEEWLRVTAIGSAPTYTVTRDLAGLYSADDNPVWKAGTPVVKQGAWSSTTGNNYTAPTLTGGTDTDLTNFETLIAGDNNAKFNLTINETEYEDVAVTFALGDIDDTTYDSKSGEIYSNPQAIFFSSDGTKIYQVRGSTDTIYQFTVATPWDISTINTTVVASDSIEDRPNGVFFKPDGTKMFIKGYDTGSHRVYAYTLSTAWDLSTSTTDGVYGNVVGDSKGLFFSPNGSKMFVLTASSDQVVGYTLSTPWLVSSASADGKTKSLSSQDNTPKQIWFNDIGTRMFMIGTGTANIYQYTLSTAWDVSTLSYTNKSYNIETAASATNPYGMFFKADGLKLYIAFDSDHFVYQFSTDYVTNYTEDVIATSIQTSIRAATSLTETVTYDTDHYIITGVTDDYYITASSPSAGTDISGSGYLDLADGVSILGGYGTGGWLRLIGEGTNSPYYSVFKRLSGAYNDYEETCRLGNLNGFLDYTSDEYGIALGNSEGSLKYDPTNGLRIRGNVVQTTPLTAGENINATIPVPIYIDTADGDIMICDDTDAGKLAYTGFALTDALSGASPDVQFSGVVGGFTGLSIGSTYYLYNSLDFIDQTTFSVGGGTTFGFNTSNYKCGQTFLYGEEVANSKLKTVSINIRRINSPTDNIVVKLYASDKTTLLATSDEETPVADGGDNVLLFSFPTPYEMVTGTEYFFEVTRTGSLSTTNYYNLNKSSSSVYTDGSRYYWNNAAGTWDIQTDDVYMVLHIDSILSTSAGSNSVKVGRAISATGLLIYQLAI